MQRTLKVSKRRLITIIFYLTVVFGAFYPNMAMSQAILGARAVALGQASTALPNSLWAVFDNPAMMSSDNLDFSFFGIRYYGLPELTDLAATGSYPAKWGVVGFGFHRYGFELYSENRIRVGYKNEYQGFHYGLVFNYNKIIMGGGYGSTGALGIDVGIAAILTKGLWIAGRVTNINQPKYKNIDESLPRELAVGLSYQPSDLVLFTSEVVKDVLFPISFRGGVEITVFEDFKGRMGVTTEPVTFSGGFGYTGSKWEINIVVQNHTQLGISPGLDLSVKI